MTLNSKWKTVGSPWPLKTLQIAVPHPSRLMSALLRKSWVRKHSCNCLDLQSVEGSWSRARFSLAIFIYVVKVNNSSLSKVQEPKIVNKSQVDFFFQLKCNHGYCELWYPQCRITLYKVWNFTQTEVLHLIIFQF